MFYPQEIGGLHPPCVYHRGGGATTILIRFNDQLPHPPCCLLCGRTLACAWSVRRCVRYEVSFSTICATSGVNSAPRLPPPQSVRVLLGRLKPSLAFLGPRRHFPNAPDTQPFKVQALQGKIVVLKTLQSGLSCEGFVSLKMSRLLFVFLYMTTVRKL